jgi:hypothetical protein
MGPNTEKNIRIKIIKSVLPLSIANKEDPE